MDNWRSIGPLVPKVRIPTGQTYTSCVDFYTHGTLENGDEDRSNKFIILANNSQIYQNVRSIVLGIVVRRIVKAFLIIILFCCCSLVVWQGYCSFVQFVFKVC